MAFTPPRAAPQGAEFARLRPGGRFDPTGNRGRPNARLRRASPRFRAAGGHAAPLSPTKEGEPLTPDRARAAPDPRAARVALARPGCAWLRGRPLSRAQRGPRSSLQPGHDSAGGSGADGGRDVPARVLQERRPYGPFLGRGPGRAGLHSCARSAPRRAQEQADGVTDRPPGAGLARRVPPSLRGSSRHGLLRGPSQQTTPRPSSARPFGSATSARQAASRYEELLAALATDPVPLRPNRSEPRAVKRRPKVYQLMTKSRHLMRVSKSRRQK